MAAPMRRKKIPETDSIEELARFWDTHDLTDFEDQLEQVHEPVFERQPGATLTIRLEPHEAEAIRRMAAARGVGDAALVREWVLEKLQRS